MGIALPQVVTSDRASGAQVIDGSLKFDGSNKTRIIKTFSSAGNRQSWTWSCWTKRDTLTRSDRQVIFGGYGASNDTDWLEIGWDSGADHVYFTTNSITADGTAQRRDPQGWYHFFSTYDGSTLKIYVNNRLDLSHSFTGDRGINVNGAHYIGQTPANSVDRYLYAKLSQCYFIDGQVLTPESFGFTDGLTNTWRPKKYTGTYNTTGVDYSSQAVLTGTIYSGAGGVDKIFDGTTATCGPNVNSYVTFTPSTAIPITSSFRIRANVSNASGDAVFAINGSDVSTIATGFPASGGIVNAASTWTTITGYTELTSLKFGWINHWMSVSGIEIDGVELLDMVAGVNGFYLPMDGNSPIGEDKSGAGNNWTPVNFGGSVALDNPIVSGARPILNTDGGGNVARPGVFGSEVGAYYAVTVSNPGSGNKYYLDGVLSANPTLTRGATYTFDQSDSSNSGHPLRFATAADAAGSTQYTDGVSSSGTPGSAGAFTRITVPHNSADTLYYYCTNHNGMGSSTSQITDETKADPYAWKNVLALPLVGSKDDVSTQILPVINDVTRLRFKTDWNWMYVSAIEINGTILTTGTLDNSGGVWSGGDNWKNGSVGSGNETYSQSARGDWFDVTLASTLNIDTLRIYVYLDASAGSTTNIFELELFYGNGTSYLKTLPSNSDAPNGNFNQRSWQDFGSVRFVPVTANGNAAASSDTSNFYNGSFEFDGSGDGI